MKESPARDALRRIQDVITHIHGSPLTGDAEKRVEEVLVRLSGAAGNTVPSENFLVREVTILLADLRGFTSIAATYPAGAVLDLLNRCFVRLSEIVLRHQGTIDKFMGDSFMVLFGTARTGENEVKRALSCAVDMQIEMDRINKEYRSEGLPELYMGIGINTGEVMAGMLGSDLYSAYTVIGDEVNLASRIEAFSLRGQVLISQNTFDRCRDFVRTGDPMEVYVKGKSNRVTMHEVLGIPSESRELPRQEIRRSVRVEVKLPLVFHIVHGKIVLPEARQGTILDIGYHGILIEVAQPIPLHTDLKVAFDLPLVGFRVENLWAKVVKVKDAEGRHLAGLEFTSIGAEEKSKLQLFVQLLIQGSDNK